MQKRVDPCRGKGCIWQDYLTRGDPHFVIENIIVYFMSLIYICLHYYIR